MNHLSAPGGGTKEKTERLCDTGTFRRFAGYRKSGSGEWRAHFHVPVLLNTDGAIHAKMISSEVLNIQNGH